MISSMSQMTKDARPTVFHHMLATIAKEGRLLRLYSQNVDGIDTGLTPLATCVPLRKNDQGKWPCTIQLHGGLDKMVCSKCGELSDFDAELFTGPTPPACAACLEINSIRTEFEGKRSHGIGRLRPRMVLYNEHNPDDEAIGSVTREDLRKRPDAVIVVGTTLKVPGVRRIVREMCGVVRDRRDGVAIWVNNNLPPVSKDLEDCFDIVVQGSCDDVALRAAMPNWDQPADEQSAADVRKAAANLEINKGMVCLPASQDSSAGSDTGLLTPVPELNYERGSLEEIIVRKTKKETLQKGLLSPKQYPVKKIPAPKTTIKRPPGRPRLSKKKVDVKSQTQTLTFASTKSGIRAPSSQLADGAK
nr:nad-dependent protein deacetylase hst4 [Quercus suber]